MGDLSGGHFNPAVARKMINARLGLGGLGRGVSCWTWFLRTSGDLSFGALPFFGCLLGICLLFKAS